MVEEKKMKNESIMKNLKSSRRNEDVVYILIICVAEWRISYQAE